MKLPFISLVAFLLCSVIAERNGPTNILVPRRRSNGPLRENHTRRSSGGGRMLNIKIENSKNGRRWPAGTFKVTSVSKTVRTSQSRKFPRVMTTKNPFISTAGGYFGNRRSHINKSRRFSTAKFNPARRSIHLNVEPDQLSTLKVNDDAIFLEPIYRDKPEKDFLGYLFGKHLSLESNDVLGPMVGPLNLGGIGKNVYIRLMVSPDKETASHVKLHLVNEKPVKKFSHIHENGEYLVPEKEKPFHFAKEFENLSPFPLKKLIVDRNPLNPRRSRFVDKSIHPLALTPPNVEPFGLFRVQNHREIHQEIRSNDQQNSIGNSGQYSPAQQHHQLPLLLRPSDNLNDLPIYPPLTEAGSGNKNEEKILDENKVQTEGQIDTEISDDTQHSASSKHTSISRHYPPFPIARKFINILMIPGPEAIAWNRGESPEPVFIKEIKAPDLSPGNIPTVTSKSNYFGSVNLREENSSSTTPAAEEDERVIVSATSKYESRLATTSRTKYDPFSQNPLQPGEHYADDDPDNLQVRATTSNPSATENSGEIAGKGQKQKKKKINRVD